jgi:hypothetical protein
VPGALDLAREALEARKDGRLDECVERDRASLALEEHPYVRLHLASCLDGVGRLIEALRAAKMALEAGIRNGDEELTAAAQKRVAVLLPRLAHVILRFDVPGERIELDGMPVPRRLLSRRVPIDPGKHRVTRSGGDCRDIFFDIAEGEELSIDASVCRPEQPPEFPPEAKIHTLLGLGTSAYTDTNGVNVLTPAVNAAIGSPERGWNVAASYLVDVISAASPDTVSTASPRFHESRHQVTADGGYKLGVVLAQLRSKVSTEPDCFSITGGGALSLDLNDKLVIPRIGYAHRHDRIGVRDTPFSELERPLSVNDFEAGVSFVLSPTTILVSGATLETMRGDPSNPYRFVPLFAPDVAPAIPRGASGDLVNAVRLPFRPREQLPTERDRFALAARIHHRFPSATIRVEERVYADTWGIKASTTDARYVHDFGERLGIGPHLRLHGQSAASFYQLAYVAAADTARAASTLPLYRTTARELSPMIALTAGASARVLLTSETAETRLSLVLSSDVMHSHYFESLFVTTRTAFYSTLGFEAEL